MSRLHVTYLHHTFLIFPIYIYYLQKQLTQFGLEMSLIYESMSISTFWVQYSWKILNYIKFYVLNCFKYFLIYILRQNVIKKWNKNFLNNIKSSEYMFWDILSEKFRQGKLNFIKSSCITFCAKMLQYFHIV